MSSSSSLHWTKTTLPPTHQWYTKYPPILLDSTPFKDAIQLVQNDPSLDIATVLLKENEVKELESNVTEIKDLLENKIGFVIIEGDYLFEKFSRREICLLYYLIGQLLGKPLYQNAQNVLLYDVKDEKKSLSEGARFSVTSYESGFHTDNCFGDEIVDYVGLLCYHQAKEGGASQIVSGLTVFEELKQKHPDLLNLLKKEFFHDKRGGVRPGEAKIGVFPIYNELPNGVLLRYLRAWIEAGHEKAETPLTETQLKAFNTIDAIANQKHLQAEFYMKQGDMFFINNRWIMHNRTSFVDFDELEKKRHLVRLWIGVRP